MKTVLVTNNPLTEKNVLELDKVYLDDKTYLDVLCYVRDEIHKGAKILTHPLTSSIKPGETPYKSILIERPTKTELDFNSLTLIENSIDVVKKFLVNTRNRKAYTKEILFDFQTIDYLVIKSGIESMGGLKWVKFTTHWLSVEDQQD